MSKKKILAILLFIVVIAYAVYLANWIPQYTNTGNVVWTEICKLFGTDPKSLITMTAGSLTAIGATYGIVRDRANKAISQVQQTASDVTSSMSNSLQIVENEKTQVENLLLAEQTKVATLQKQLSEDAQLKQVNENLTLQLSKLTAEREALSRQLQLNAQTAKATVCLNDVMKRLNNPSLSPATIANALKAGGIEVILK